MPEPQEKWSLAELIDFEVALASWDGEAAPVERQHDGRAAGLKRWLKTRREADGPPHQSPGERWVGALSLAAILLGLLAAAFGAAAAWGTLDRDRNALNVVWFLAATLFLPWLMLLLGALGWLLRGRVAGFGALGWLTERVSVRLLDPERRTVIEKIRRSGEISKVLGWRLAQISQRVAADFHGGAFIGFGAMILFKSVGFFWETTTEQAMAGALSRLVEILALPWAAALPGAVPDVPGSEITADWRAAGDGWWPFLLLALLVWGLAPRLLLVGYATWRERRLLDRLTFQAPHHRKLWRALTEVRRGGEPEGPVDGALILTLGGARPDPATLRPFLLNRLRMNPTAWESLGVLDQGREEAAREALDKAPAGVVLLAEGWSLAPRQVERALDEVRARVGDRRLVVLVANLAEDGGIEPPSDTERRTWERFLDDREDEPELVFYERS